MKISVCMATYNGAKHIKVQLASILSQLDGNDEIVIVDDGSTDNTVEIIKSFNDERVRLSLNTVNIGVVRTFDRALHLVKGDWVFLSDQDDCWYDNKVARIRSLFLTQDVDLIVHDARVITGLNIISNSLFDICNSSPSVLRNIISSTHTGCCMAFKRSVLNEILPIPNKIGVFHDSWIGIITGCLECKKIFLKEPLIDYYRHGENVSSMKTRSIFKIIPERMSLIIQIIKRLLKIYINRNQKKERHG